MHTKRNGIAVDIITLRWDAKCATCGAKMLKGNDAWWHPKSKWMHGGTRPARETEVLHDGDVTIMRRLPQQVESRFVGTVTHLPNQECQSMYVVKAIYDSTSQEHKIAAFAVDAALNTIHRKLTLRKYLTHPAAYVAYQGNVLVKAVTAKELQ